MKSITQLKTLMAESTDLSQPLDYFFDLMEDVKLRDAGKILNHKKIEKRSELAFMMQSIEKTISDFLGKKICIHHPLLMFVPEEQFFHGTFSISETTIPLPLLYSADLKVGIFALSSFENTDMFRFSLVELDELKNPH